MCILVTQPLTTHFLVFTVTNNAKECYKPRRSGVRLGALLPLVLLPLVLLPLPLVPVPVAPPVPVLLPSLLRNRPGVEMTWRLADVSRPSAARAPFSAAFLALLKTRREKR